MIQNIYKAVKREDHKRHEMHNPYSEHFRFDK